MALLKRISKYGLENCSGRPMRASSIRITRHYSSFAESDSQPDDAGPGPVRGKIGWNLPREWPEEVDRTVSKKLWDLVSFQGPRSWKSCEEAWQCYSQLSESARIPSVKAALVEYLGSSKSEKDAERTLLLFDSLSINYRGGETYQAAISASLVKGRYGKAVNLYREAQNYPFGPALKAKRLLAQLVKHGEWELAIYLTRLLSEHEACPEDWESSLNIDVDKAHSLASHIKALADISPKFHIHSGYIREFLDHVTSKALEQANVSNPDTVWSLFSILTGLACCGREHYETALKSLLHESSVHAEYSNRPKIAIALYNNYRQMCLASGEKPSHVVLHRLLYRVTVHRALSPAGKVTVGTVVADWKRFYGHLPLRKLLLLMGMHAERGEAEKVDEYFQEVLQLVSQPTTRALWPLVYVHARRADVPEAVKQFERISREFNVKPDLQCWNVLIHAYCRADDLEGASERLHEMTRAGVAPDAYSIGPLLNICAQRGDVDGVEDLLQIATQQRVRKTTVMMASLLLAHLNNNDEEMARKILRLTREAVAAGTVSGPLTGMYNMLLSHYALRRNMDSVMVVHQEMQNSGIPLDWLTYAGLLQVLCGLHQTDAGWKILREVMPANGIRVQAFHYAIIMAGYIAEGQFQKVIRVQDRMLSRNVHPTASTRLPVLMAKAALDLKKMRSLGYAYRDARFFNAEQYLQEIVQRTDSREIAQHQPQKGLNFDPLSHTYYESYFAMMIQIYGHRNAFNAVEDLLDKYNEAANSPEYIPSLRLIVGVMRSFHNAGKHDRVKDFWLLAKKLTAKLVVTWQGASKDRKSPPLQDTPPAIAPAYRHILSVPLATYLSSLHRLGDWTGIQETVESAIESGYTLDDRAWNLYVQFLARGGRIIQAFEACENNLTSSSFPGWNLRDQFNRYRPARGLEHVKINPRTLKPGSLMLRYKTAVVLAGALQHVRSLDALGWPEGVERVRGEEIARVAPRTMGLVESLPRFEDNLQGHFLRGGKEDYGLSPKTTEKRKEIEEQHGRGREAATAEGIATKPISLPSSTGKWNSIFSAPRGPKFITEPTAQYLGPTTEPNNGPEVLDTAAELATRMRLVQSESAARTSKPGLQSIPAQQQYIGLESRGGPSSDDIGGLFSGGVLPIREEDKVSDPSSLAASLDTDFMGIEQDGGQKNGYASGKRKEKRPLPVTGWGGDWRKKSAK